MTDIYSRRQRSLIMSRVRTKRTSAESDIACILDEVGIRYLQNVRDLPGTPDFVLEGAPVVIFAHGCFWHGHRCNRGRLPNTGDPVRDEFWKSKIESNTRRDAWVAAQLRRAGYAVITVWQCEIRDRRKVLRRIRRAINRKQQL